MKLDELLPALFPEGHKVKVQNWLVQGTATVAGKPVAVLGSTGTPTLGIRECTRLAQCLLDIIEKQPRCPIIMLVDNAGQRMALDEELLVLPEYVAHLIACQQLARNQGHPLIAVIYGNSIAGGFLAFGMEADAIYTVEGAETSVMKLEAIARVTKMPLEDLQKLAKKVSVFAPGCDNFYKMGGLTAMWTKDYARLLAEALATVSTTDQRSSLGKERGGRTQAHDITEQVLHA